MRSSALETSNGIRLTFNDDDSILSIANVQVSHSGNYTCIVSNEAATVTYSSFLHVNGNSFAPFSFIFFSHQYNWCFSLFLPSSSLLPLGGEKYRKSHVKWAFTPSE